MIDCARASQLSTKCQVNYTWQDLIFFPPVGGLRSGNRGLAKRWSGVCEADIICLGQLKSVIMLPSDFVGSSCTAFLLPNFP